MVPNINKLLFLILCIGKIVVSTRIFCGGELGYSDMQWILASRDSEKYERANASGNEIGDECFYTFHLTASKTAAVVHSREKVCF